MRVGVFIRYTQPVVHPFYPQVFSLARVLFADTARQLHTNLTEAGVGLFDMRGEPHLETRLATAAKAKNNLNGLAPRQTLSGSNPKHLLPMTFPTMRRHHRFAIFLDGSQRTLPGYFVGSIPVVASVVTAGVLDRNALDGPAIMPGMIATRRVWICPRRSGLAALDAFIRNAESLGERVVDPLDGLDEAALQRALSDYPRLEQRAYAQARAMRAELETELFDRWLDGDPVYG